MTRQQTTLVGLCQSMQLAIGFLIIAAEDL